MTRVGCRLGAPALSDAPWRPAAGVAQGAHRHHRLQPPGAVFVSRPACLRPPRAHFPRSARPHNHAVVVSRPRLPLRAPRANSGVVPVGWTVQGVGQGVFRWLSTHPSLCKSGGGKGGRGSGGGGPGAGVRGRGSGGGGVLDPVDMWITPFSQLGTCLPPGLVTRSCHLFPMSATPPAVRVPRRRGRPPPASGPPVPSAVVPRCRTRSTRRSHAAPRSRPPARAGTPPHTSASAIAAR